MYNKTVEKIKDLLTERGIQFALFEHEPAKTSEEAAAARPAYTIEQGVKALIVRAKKNGEKFFVLVVVPGDKKFDTKKVRAALGVNDVRFATEDEVRELTDGVEPGGVPPIGTVFNLPVLADAGVFENEEIIFSAGDKRVSIAMPSEDLKTVVNPQIADITT